VILPEKVLSGYTLATTLVVLYFNPATWLSFTLTFNFNFDTFTMSNNCVAGIPVMIEPTSMCFFIDESAYWCLILVSPTLMLACVNCDLAFTICSLAWSSCCLVTPPVLKAFSNRL
jgi:hypothetical protein